MIYTLGTETPGNELPKITLHEPSEVYLNLNDEPSGKLQVYAVGEDGNISRKVTYQIRHKQKQHHVKVDKEDLFGETGTFKFPDSLATYVEVIRSLTDKAVERGVINKNVADAMKNALDSLK